MEHQKEVESNPQSHPQCNYTIRSLINKRDRNEDSFTVFSLNRSPNQQPLLVMAIADGMGGHAHGESISREALRKLSLSLFEQLVVESSLNLLHPPDITPDELGKALYEAVKQANAYVKKIIQANSWGTAGSTIIVVAILDNKAIAVNLGDSPLFHYQVNSSKLTKITEDHTIANILLKAGFITPEMARVHEGRSRLQFFVGCDKLPETPPIYQVELADKDLLLLCSDGVNGSLLLEEIAAVITDKNLTLEEKADHLLETAQKRGETDNQTLILSGLFHSDLTD